MFIRKLYSKVFGSKQPEQKQHLLQRDRISSELVNISTFTTFQTSSNRTQSESAAISHRPFKPTYGTLALKIEKIPTAKDHARIRAAERLLKDIENQTRPIQNWEYLIVLYAVSTSLASCATMHEFFDSFIKEVIHYQDLDPSVTWVGSILLASLPQFALSFQSGMERIADLKRHLSNSTCQELYSDLKKHWFNLIMTALSAIPTAMVAKNSKDLEKLDPSLVTAIAALRSGAAVCVNGTGLVNYQKDEKEKQISATCKRLAQQPLEDGGKKLQIFTIDMLHKAQKSINTADADKLIKMLDQSHLITHLTGDSAPLDKMNAITRSFIALIETEEKTELQSPGIFSKVTSALACIPNWSTALGSSSLFNLPGPTNGIVDFIMHYNQKLLVGALIGGTLIGIPSWWLNYMLSAVAIQKFINGSLYQIWDKGVCNYFKEFDCIDWVASPFVLLFSLGFGIISGGQYTTYPLVKENISEIIGAIITAIPYAAVSSMALNGILGDARDRYHQHIILNALDPTKAPTQAGYYQSLNEADKKVYLKLMKKYLNIVTKTLINAFTEMNDEMLKRFFAQITQGELRDVFVSPKAPLTSIGSTSKLGIHASRPTTPLRDECKVSTLGAPGLSKS